MDIFSLRPLQTKDATHMLEWMHNKNVTKYLSFNAENATIEDALKFIKNAEDEHKDYHRAIVNSFDTYLGTISLKNIDQINKKAEYAICLHHNAMSMGVGGAATKLILEDAFKILELHEVYLCVSTDNLRAIKLYEKSGFQYYKTTDEIIKNKNTQLRWYKINKFQYRG